MNEFIRSHKKVVIAISCIIAFTIGWLLYNHFTARNNRSVNDRLDDIEREQQQTASNIESIKSEIANGRQSLDRIKSITEDSTDQTDNIYHSEQSVADSISYSQQSANAIAAADSSAKEQLAGAEAGNSTAAGAIGDASKLVEQCQQFNQSSESIFKRYEAGSNQRK